MMALVLDGKDGVAKNGCDLRAVVGRRRICVDSHVDRPLTILGIALLMPRV